MFLGTRRPSSGNIGLIERPDLARTKAAAQAQVEKNVVEPVADFEMAECFRVASIGDSWRRPSASLGDNAPRPWRSKSQSLSNFPDVADGIATP
jgi:hypothetical protein